MVAGASSNSCIRSARTVADTLRHWSWVLGRCAPASDRCGGGAVMLPTSVRIMLCTQAQDMRRSFDTLALVMRQQLGEDPQRGTLYVFVGKRRGGRETSRRLSDRYCKSQQACTPAAA